MDSINLPQFVPVGDLITDMNGTEEVEILQF